MFERYTEKARRSIFFARWEASQFGSPEIEPEHLLLGLMRHTDIPGRDVRAEIEQSLPRGEKTATSVDLPLSVHTKRALAFAAEESERAGHQHIGVEHMLLGLWRDDHPVSALLQKHGVDRETILARCSEGPPEVVTRESLRSVIEKLPDTSLPMAKRILENMPVLPGQGGMLGGFGRGGGFAGRARFETPRRGRRSSHRMEDGAEVFETRYFRDGIEITFIERFRPSDDGKTLTYTQEIHGPGGQSWQHTIDFEIPETKQEPK